MKNILAEIITIGDEILYGQITDTNSQWISEQLSLTGIKTIRKSSVGDEKQEILSILKESESRADIIIITGGLGPTNDDITKKTMSEYFDSKLILNSEALIDVTDFFTKRGRQLTEINKLQAYLPENCNYIKNRCGTAPGMWFEKNGKVFISMPGVPFEMKAMMQEIILLKLKTKFNPPVIYHKIIRTIGIGESFLAEKIAQWENNLPSHIKLAYLPSFSEVKLRLTCIGENLEDLKNEAEKETRTLNTLIHEYIYGYDETSLPKVIGEMLETKSLILSAAESCTGGLFSHMITSIPGSSNYFQGSVIAYNNDVKQSVLGVRKDTLAEFGAVSEQTVKEMAEGARKHLRTDIAVSTSGIAGPGGGTNEKPVGTIWIAYSDKNTTIAKKLMLGNDRDINIKLTCMALLNLIRQTLLEKS
jgi:nicotinamide-nucleotide amidase